MIVKQSNLGEYLREKRIAAELSQIEVARILKCRSQFISNWERGDSAPPWRLLKVLVRIYRIEESEIMDFLLKEQTIFIRKQLGFKKLQAG